MYIYIYIYIYTKISTESVLGSLRSRFRRNCSRIIPAHDLIFVIGSISYWALFVIVALQHFAVGFCSFDQLIAYLLIFFNWWDEVSLFYFFLQKIFFLFSPGSDSRYGYLWILAGFFFSFSLSPWMLVDSKLVSIYKCIYIIIIIIITKESLQHGFFFNRSHHPSLSSIALRRSSKLHPVSKQTRYMLVSQHWHDHV